MGCWVCGWKHAIYSIWKRRPFALWLHGVRGIGGIKNEKGFSNGWRGLLGSHLCERLVERGGHVLCVDNFFTGSKRNVDHLMDRHNFEIMRQYVTFPLWMVWRWSRFSIWPVPPAQSTTSMTLNHQNQRVHGVINMLGLYKRVKARILQRLRNSARCMA